MSSDEELRHLERKISKLEEHIAIQDGEIYRQSKRHDSLIQRLEKLEGRLDGDSVEEAEDPASEKPPHY